MNWTPDSVLALTKHKQSRPLWLDLLLHSIINFVRKQSLIFCQYQVSCVGSSFDQLTKPTGLTSVLVDLRSRKFSSMTSKLVQSCHSTLSSNRIIYQRLLSKIMGASSQYRANLEGKFTVDSRPTDTSPLRRELQWNASRNDWIRLPFLPRTQAITEVRTISCHPAKHFTRLFSYEYLWTSSRCSTSDREMTKQVKKVGVFSFIIINWLGIVIEIFQWHTLFDFKKLYLTSPSTSTSVMIIRNNWNLKFFAKTFTSFPLINSSSFVKPAWRSFPRGHRYKRKQKYEKDFYVWQLFL